MIERVLLVAWKGSAATAWVETLRSGGYTVLLEDTTGERAWRTAKERGIDCVIIDGQKKPSHGRQTGHALRDTAKTRNIPIIWTNLDNEDTESVRSEVKPDVTLVAPTDASGALAALQALHANHLANGVTREDEPQELEPVAIVESAPAAEARPAAAPVPPAKKSKPVRAIRAARSAKTPRPAPAARKKAVAKTKAKAKKRVR